MAKSKEDLKKGFIEDFKALKKGFIEDFKAFATIFAVFIPLMIAALQYEQSVQEKSDENFRALIEKLSAGNTNERVAAATSMGTYIKKGGPFYDQAIDVLVNTVSTELDPNVLNAIRGSLEKIDKKDYKSATEKLLAIDRNLYIYEYPTNSWKNITQTDITTSEKKIKEAQAQENESGVNKIILNNLENDLKQKQETYSKFEKEYNDLRLNKEFVVNFISSFLNSIESPIIDLNFYRNSMSYIVLDDLELTRSRIDRSAFTDSTIANTTFDEVTIVKSAFTFSKISQSKFVDCKIESSLFDQVIFEDVNFSGCEFKEVYFAGSDLTKVNFKNVKGLKEIYFYKAKNIDKAEFDPEFKKKIDEVLKNMTEVEFKEYIYDESELAGERRDNLFTTLDKLSP
jgi:uncharacterized protein YjbI with pentapeptide repeats